MKLLGNKISMATVLICISLMNACSYNEICNSIDVSMVDSVMVNVAEDEHSETSTDSLSGITDSQLTTEPSRVPDKTVTDVAQNIISATNCFAGLTPAYVRHTRIYPQIIMQTIALNNLFHG